MADIQYLNYGDQQIEQQALLNTLANQVQNYVAGQPWSAKRKEKFMSAYTDIMNRGIQGANSNTGVWQIKIGGTPIEYQSNKDKEMYEEAAYFIQQQMAKLSKSSTVKEEEKSDLPIFSNEQFLSDITKSINNDKFGGLSEGFKTSDWNEFDKRDSTGKRGRTERASILASQLEKYRDSLSEEKYNFKDSPFGSLEEFKTRLNSAIAALNSPDEADDKEALQRIGIRESDWFNNGLGDSSGKTIKLEDGTEWFPTYGDLIEYNQKLEEQKQVEKAAAKKALADNRYAGTRRYNISGYNGTPITDQKSIDSLTSKLSTFQKLSADDLSKLTWAFKHSGINLEDLSREEFIKMPAQYRKAGRLKKISELPGIYYDTIGGGLVQPYNNDQTQSSLSDIIIKNELENSKEYKRTKADERKLNDGFKAEDYLRMGSISQDILASLAAFVPTYGTATSAALGVGSLGTNMAADIMDDSVSAGEVVKNAAINLGLGVVGLVPGWGAAAKSSKWLPRIAKWTPRIIAMVAAGQLALSDDVQNSLKKAANTNDWKSLTNHDMKNIAYALSAIAGLTRVGRGIVNDRKYGAAFEGNTKTEKYITTKSGKQIKVTDEQLKAINKAGKKHGTAKANEELRKIPGAENEEVDIEFKTGLLERSPEVKATPKTISSEVPHRTQAYQRLLKIQNEKTKAAHPIISKIIPTDYDIYKGVANLQTPKIDFVERIKKAWNPISEGKFKTSVTAEKAVANYRQAIHDTPELRNYANPPKNKFSRATSVPQPNHSQEIMQTVDPGKQVILKHTISKNDSNIDVFEVEIPWDPEKAKTINSLLKGKSTHEQKKILGNELNKINERIVRENNLTFKKDDSKWKSYVESVKKLKRLGYLFKEGGKITDSQIDNFLKQYK